MRNHHKTAQLLSDHQLRKTTFREQVLTVFLQAFPKALTRNEIEQDLQQELKVDRVTLYRTLKSFEDVGLIHLAIDNSDEQRFALCSNDCTTHQHQDQHAHFYCTNCNQTVCLEEVTIPQVKVPDTYQLEDTQLVLSGICKECTAE
jgi:Fur family ferric uptake transcriptional regulator